MGGAALKLGLLLVLVVRVFRGPGQRVGQHEAVGHYVKEGLGGAGIDVLRGRRGRGGRR